MTKTGLMGLARLQKAFGKYETETETETGENMTKTRKTKAKTRKTKAKTRKTKAKTRKNAAKTGTPAKTAQAKTGTPATSQQADLNRRVYAGAWRTGPPVVESPYEKRLAHEAKLKRQGVNQPPHIPARWDAPELGVGPHHYQRFKNRAQIVRTSVIDLWTLNSRLWKAYRELMSAKRGESLSPIALERKRRERRRANRKARAVVADIAAAAERRSSSCRS